MNTKLYKTNYYRNYYVEIVSPSSNENYLTSKILTSTHKIMSVLAKVDAVVH